MEQPDLGCSKKVWFLINYFIFKFITFFRRNDDLWLPTSSSCICSTHFVGGIKSDNPNSNAYYPSIFQSTNHCTIFTLINEGKIFLYNIYIINLGNNKH